MTKKELIKYFVEYHHEDKAELKKMKKDDLQGRYDEYNDTSSMHPNETYKEFMEHESPD